MRQNVCREIKTDRQIDRRTNIMAITQRFVLANALHAKMDYSQLYKEVGRRQN